MEKINTKLFTEKNMRNILSFYNLISIDSGDDHSVGVFPNESKLEPEQRDYIYACYLCKAIDRYDPAKAAQVLMSNLDYDLNGSYVDKKRINLKELKLNEYDPTLVVGFIKTASLEQGDSIAYGFCFEDDDLSYVIQQDPHMSYTSTVNDMANLLSITQ